MLTDVQTPSLGTPLVPLKTDVPYPRTHPVSRPVPYHLAAREQAMVHGRAPEMHALTNCSSGTPHAIDVHRFPAEWKRGEHMKLAMPWLCFKCLFTLPVSCVMFQTSVTKSTPNFCTPSRDNIDVPHPCTHPVSRPSPIAPGGA